MMMLVTILVVIAVTGFYWSVDKFIVIADRARVRFVLLLVAFVLLMALLRWAADYRATHQEPVPMPSTDDYTLTRGGSC